MILRQPKPKAEALFPPTLRSLQSPCPLANPAGCSLCEYLTFSCFCSVRQQLCYCLLLPAKQIPTLQIHTHTTVQVQTTMPWSLGGRQGTGGQAGQVGQGNGEPLWLRGGEGRRGSSGENIIIKPNLNIKIIQKMVRGARKPQPRCEQHEFSLKPRGGDYMVHPQHLCASFCSDNVDKSPKRAARPNPCLNCPTFHQDNNHATPAFVLISEKTYYEQRGDKMREEHDRKMLDYSDEKTSLNVPKPRSKNNFCSVCRQNYEDYLEHIQSLPHRKKINASNFNRHIVELAEKYVRTAPKTPPLRPKRYQETRNTVASRNEPDSDDVEIISNPNKRVKPNEGEEARAQVGAGVGSGVGGGYFKPFSSTYQDQMNQYTLNYNMHIYMSPLMMGYPPYDHLSFLPTHPSQGVHPFLNFPVGLPPRLRPVTCIVIDE